MSDHVRVHQSCVRSGSPRRGHAPTRVAGGAPIHPGEPALPRRPELWQIPLAQSSRRRHAPHCDRRGGPEHSRS
jgi:hypothetical protein